MVSDMHGDGGKGGNRLRWALWGVAAGLLALPAIAMRLTREVHWTGGDFAVMGAMLFGACAAYEVAMRMSTGRAYRAGAGAAILCGFLMVWSNLAVGIVGSEDNPYNLVFFAILALAGLGGALGGFRPRALSRTFYGVAALQALAAAWGATQDIRGAWVSCVFVALWLLAAWLFGVAARTTGQ